MPSQNALRVTIDGRKRAPQNLFGTKHIKPFPWVRVLTVAGVGAYFFRNWYQTQFQETQAQRFLRKVQIAPYGVLGTQLTLQGSLARVASEPTDSTVIVDPAGLKYIQTVAAAAGGAAGAIYNWIGLKGAFPEEVRRYVLKVCDAKLYEYPNSKRVIHVVGPDFREGQWSEREAAIELSRAYRNVLHEFVISEGDTLRMLPISGGVFSGPLYNQMPPLTQQALSMAFEQLHQFDREYILRDAKSIELCIFMNREWDMYNKVFQYVAPSAKL
jgi:O-acetyl-ADP-ribose deacetylase (regulator of RNase III)